MGRDNEEGLVLAGDEIIALILVVLLHLVGILGVLLWPFVLIPAGMGLSREGDWTPSIALVAEMTFYVALIVHPISYIASTWGAINVYKRKGIWGMILIQSLPIAIPVGLACLASSHGF